MTIAEVRNILHTDRSLDDKLARRALGALSGKWALQKRAHTVEEWLISTPSVAEEVRQFVKLVAEEKTRAGRDPGMEG